MSSDCGAKQDSAPPPPHQHVSIPCDLNQRDLNVLNSFTELTEPWEFSALDGSWPFFYYPG